MPWIQNIALADITKKHHIAVNDNSMLIQIVDPGMEFPKALHGFNETYQFQFLDLEENDPWGDEFKITDEQAAELVELLKRALGYKMDVVVHCVAGVCRSGAVAEVGIMMGFKDTETYRSPNLMVKHKMMKYLGWTYDENEPHTINGAPFEYDCLNNKVFIPKPAGSWVRPPEQEGDI